MSPDFIKNIYDLFLDIAIFYQREVQGLIKQLPATKKLSDNIRNVKFDGIEETTQRFMQLMDSIGMDNSS